MNEWTSGVLEVRGGRIAYHRTGGDRRPLVLSHGLTDNGLCWTRVARALAPDFDVIMLDARGHGASSPMPRDAPHDGAEDIAGAIAALGLTRPVVMGHSVGARATARYANAWPDQVSKVILEDPPFLPPANPQALEARREKFRQQVARFQAMTEAEITAMGRATSPGWHDEDFPAWARGKMQVDPEAMPSYPDPWETEIAKIAAPTLLIRGQPDLGGLVTPEIAAAAARINPRIRAVPIPGAGHNIRRENFPDYLSAVRAFLAED